MEITLDEKSKMLLKKHWDEILLVLGTVIATFFLLKGAGIL